MTNPPENSRSFDWRRWLPWMLFGFALVLRLIGSAWGLPNKDRYWSYHPDEPLNLLYARQINIGAGDFDPGFYNYGTFFLSLSSIADKVVSGYSPLDDSPSREALAIHDAKVSYACRMINIFAGAGTVLLVFLILKRFQGLLASTIGALLIAVAPGHVVHSRFMTVDVFATFWIAASFYAAMRLVPIPDDVEEVKGLQSWSYPLLAGLFAGLSAGTKYTGILVLVALFVVLAWVRPDKWILKTIGAIVASIGAFIVTTPGCLTNPEKFKADLAYELAHSRSGHGLVFEGMPSSYLVHLTNLVVGVGLIVTLLSLAGFFMGARSKSIPLIASLAFFVVFYVFLGRAEIAFLRYTFPLYVAMAIGLGWFVEQMQSYEKLAKSFTALAILGLGGLPFGDGLMATGRFSVAMAGTDSRDAVIRFFNQLSSKATVSVGVVADPWFYSPPYYPDANSPRFVPFDARNGWMRTGPFLSPARPEQFIPTQEPKFDWDIRLITESKPEYIVFSSFEMADLDRLVMQNGTKAPEIQLQVDRYKAFMEALETNYKGAFFAGSIGATVHDMEYVRPQIWVWKRK